MVFHEDMVWTSMQVAQARPGLNPPYSERRQHHNLQDKRAWSNLGRQHEHRRQTKPWSLREAGSNIWQYWLWSVTSSRSKHFTLRCRLSIQLLPLLACTLVIPAVVYHTAVCPTQSGHMQHTCYFYPAKCKMFGLPKVCKIIILLCLLY